MLASPAGGLWPRCAPNPVSGHPNPATRCALRKGDCKQEARGPLPLREAVPMDVAPDGAKECLNLAILVARGRNSSLLPPRAQASSYTRPCSAPGPPQPKGEGDGDVL